MAQRTRVEVVCDRHRGDVLAAGVLEIILDGQRTKLDLCSDHLKQARRDLRPWIQAGSPPPDRQAGRRNTASSQRRASAELRSWAAANGYELPARGRIPAAVHEAYVAAQ